MTEKHCHEHKETTPVESPAGPIVVEDDDTGHGDLPPKSS